MISPLDKNYKGLISITGPTRSGKSQLAEFFIKEHDFVTYIATSKPRIDDPEWQQRIDLHRKRRPDKWRLVEHPDDICNVIESIKENETVLIDSLGGLVEDHLDKNNDQWANFQKQLITCFTANRLCIVLVSEEVGWGIIPSTSIGHLFRERLTNMSSLMIRNSKKRWLAINGSAIDLDIISDPIP